MDTAQPTQKAILDFYIEQSEMSSAGLRVSELEALPEDVETLVRTVQHLLLYDVVADDFYGFQIPNHRENEIHIRSVEGMIGQLLVLDKQPLSTPRPVNKRLTGRCRHYALLLISALRAKGRPARARCGFATYFNPPYFEDHWVCEYWNSNQGRWALADPQLDRVWRERLSFTDDVLDVPRGLFLVAADAWNLCRASKLQPERFGIEFADARGLWFIAGNLVRDIAALNKMEMLPWDIWGGQPQPKEKLTEEQLAFFDQLAKLTADPDDSFDELREIYQRDERLSVPTTVFNAILERPEPIETTAEWG